MRHLLACLTLSLLAIPSAHAQAAPPLAGLEGATATVFQKGQSSFSGLALRARLTSTRFVPEISFLPYLEYWRNSTRLDAFELRAVRRDATLGVDARYQFRAGNWLPYAGAGLGVHFLSSELDSPVLGVDDANDALTKGAFTLLGGLLLGEGERFSEFVEVKYHFLPREGQLKLHLGLSWNLNAAPTP